MLHAGRRGGAQGRRAALEQAAESADSAASRKCVGELSDYLNHVETIAS
jgi:hypothetical protein